MSKTPIFALFIALFFSLNTYAQNPQEIINQQDWITRQQQNKIDEEKRFKEQETIEKERQRREKNEDELKKNSALQSKSNNCFEVSKIELLGATLISKNQQRKILSPYLGQCFDGKKIAELIAQLNNFYQKKGYISTQILVPKQNIFSGNLALQIIEGKIEKIAVGENSITDKMQEFTAFGTLKGEYLNINDINQGLYQINRLPSNHATMKIEPGSTEGESSILIQNNKTFPARATIGYDNLGNNFTGVKRSNAVLSTDNLFFVNDALNLSYSTNLNDDDDKKNLNAFSASMAIPLHNYTLTLDYSKSDFRGTNQGVSGPLSLTGFSNRKNITLDRLLLSSGNLRISASTSLSQKESASYLNKVRIDNSQRKLTIANLAFSISNYFENGISLYLRPSYSRGLKILDAKKDQQGLAADTPRAQFQLIKLYASISKKFILPKINQPLIYALEADSQISKNTLFGSEQFMVGGYYSVRGFRENYLVGDSGYYLRNKLSFAAFNFLRFEPFFDYGYVHNRFDNSSGRLSGSGLKTIFDSKYFNAAITFSKGLNQSKNITTNKKEDKLIYFELSATCC